MGPVFIPSRLKTIARRVFADTPIESITPRNAAPLLTSRPEHRSAEGNVNRRRGRIVPPLEELRQSCIRHTRPVTSPLALISQVQRSGGTLLSQLFDGHPELHAHPHELKIGYPTKYTWPKLDLNDTPERWLETLFEESVLNHFSKGYKKEKKRDDAFLFLFLPSVQREIFLHYLASLDAVTLRDVFDAYMTSYFGAWLNNQNSSGHKKFITGFTARLAMSEESMKAFFDIYPDGRLISVVRDPRNWYPSAIRHTPRVCRNVSEAAELWGKNARAMVRNQQRYGDRACIITFEDLVGKTEAVMRYLARFLEIRFDDVLLTPTFNTYPIKANTSFRSEGHGIVSSTLHRHRTLSPEECEIIDNTTRDLHRQLLSLAIRFE
jgi:Sulfotransferase family